MSEHDFEEIRGLPGHLPSDERLVWQGAPDAWRLACEAFHIRAVGCYFALMIGWRAASRLAQGVSPGRALSEAAAVSPLAILALALLGGLAVLYSRTTVYTITSRRVVLRFGLALPKAINLPFSQIESAAVKRRGATGGDLALTLKSPNKIAFLHLWPNVRPWRLARPEPSFTALNDLDATSAALVSAMKDVAPITVSSLSVPAGPRPAGSGPSRPEVAAA